MQRRVLLGAGAVALGVAAFLVLKSTSHHVAGHVLDQTIDQIIATLPAGYSATHGVTDVNPLTGAATIHDLAVRRDGTLNWSADRLTLSGANQDALRAVFDPAAYTEGHAAWTGRRLLISDALVSGLHIFTPGTTALIKSVTLHMLSGRPFMLSPTPEHLNDPAFRADAALAFSVQSVDESNLAVSSAAPETKTLSIGSISLHDYDGGVVGAAALHDLSLHGGRDSPRSPTFHLTLDRAEIRDLNLAAPLGKLRQHGPADKSALSGLTYSSFDFAGLKIDVSPGPHVSLAGMHGTFPPADASGVRSGDFALLGLTLALKDTAIPPASAAVLAAFGMNSFTIDITAKTRTTTTPPHSDVTEDVVLHDLGTLKLATGFSGFNRTAFQNDPKAVLLTTPIEHATLEWDDAGLLNRTLAAAATQMHTTQDVIRGQMAMPLVTLGLLIPDQPDATDQVTAFLNHPHTLLVTLNPPQKVTLAEVSQAPAETRAHLLGVRILAK